MKILSKPRTGFISCIYQFCYFWSKARTVRVRARHTARKFFLISISQQSGNSKHSYLDHVHIGGSSAIL